MFIMSLSIIVVLSLLEVCRAYAPGANPPMLTHASMDVGNIISIVIPESPDENVNVEQLTGEFRQQLERIKKQSRASKVEHGLVTLKRVLPEMSRQEKRKTLPLIRRVLQGRRVANGGSFRNWTREAQQPQRAELAREGGQFVRSRSAGNPEERIYRDYEEPGNREAVTTRTDQSSPDKDDFRRVNERTYEGRREEVGREDPARRSDQIGQEELIRREESDRPVFPNDDSSSAKMARSGPPQEWNNPNWEETPQEDARVYPETSTDCNYKLDRAIRQKEPGNEILQNDRYEKNARLSELRVNVPEEQNADVSKLDQQMAPRYSIAKQDSAENAKRNLKDPRAFELADAPGLIGYPRQSDISGALRTDCDMKKNSSGQSFDKQRQEASTFERENRRTSQRIIQDPREQSERSNITGLPSLKSNLAGRLDRWSYDDRHSSNSSDDSKVAPNVYEMLREQDINSGLAYIQAEQAGFRVNSDNEPKMAASVQFANYGSGRHLRMQRSTNGTHLANALPEATSNVTQISSEDHVHRIKGNLFERLKHLFKPPPMAKIVYTSVVLLYNNESVGHDERMSNASTETGKSLATVSPSLAEPSSSTNQEVLLVTSMTTDSPAISTTEDLVTKTPDTTGKS